jgi:hypothetical protein
MDNVKPILRRKKKHEKTKDVTNGHGGYCLGEVGEEKAFLFSGL